MTSHCRTRVASSFLYALLGVAMLPLFVGAASAQISVTSASPSSAAQATVNLNVTVNGKGFKRGAHAQWFVTGTTNPGGVTVNSTAFVSSTQLTANITVADTADIAQFDIQVANSDGRIGKGTELFSVTVTQSNASKTSSCPALTPKLATVTSCTSTLPGCLDTTFGVGGIAITNPNGQGEIPLLQVDGKIVVLGFSRSTTTGVDFNLVRYNSDGSLDSSFGNGGIVTDAVTAVDDYVWAGALQSDGKILAAGYAGGETYMAVARFNPDGTLDATFGSGGNVLMNLATHQKLPSAAWTLALQSDGKILLGGEPSKVVRLNSNGSMDTTFGNQGSVSLAVRALTTQRVTSGTVTEERILAANGGTVTRLTSSGSVDASFGPNLNGTVSADVCGSARSIAVDAANNIVVAGDDGSPLNFGLARYTPNGIPDSTFGDPVPGSAQRTGRTRVSFFGNNDRVYGLAIQGDGKLLVSGNAEGPNVSTTYYIYFALARFNPDGSLDTSFGVGGLVATAAPTPSGDAIGTGVALQPDGKIVMAGNADGTPSRFAVVRYWP